MRTNYSKSVQHLEKVSKHEDKLTELKKKMSKSTVFAHMCVWAHRNHNVGKNLYLSNYHISPKQNTSK